MEPGRYRGFEYTLDTGGIALVTFNEPERLNGFRSPGKRDFMELLFHLQFDRRVRVVVITGSGRAFSAGDDITGRRVDYPDATALTPDLARGQHEPIGTYAGLRLISQPFTDSVRRLDKITIAAINGIAIQSGLSLALACDFRVASSEARLGSGTLRFGYQPDEGGHFLLVQHMGIARAMDFLMRNRIVSAAEALELGLVHEVADPEKLLPRALALAAELAERPQVATRMLKRAVYNAAEMSWAQAMEDIASKTAVTDYHADATEGAAAFREKRPPRFNAALE